MSVAVLCVRVFMSWMRRKKGRLGVFVKAANLVDSRRTNLVVIRKMLG